MARSCSLILRLGYSFARVSIYFKISLTQLKSNEDLDDLVQEIVADISPKHYEMLTNIQTAAVKYSSLNQLKSQQIQITSFGMPSPVDVQIEE